MREQESIRRLARQLRIGSDIAEIYANIEAQSHGEFLEKLLFEIVSQREVEQRNRNLRTAGFEVMKTLENFSFDSITLPASLTQESLRNCEFIHNKQNLIMYGHPGTGKTHLATALGVEACRRGHRVAYYKTSKLVTRLYEAKDERTMERFWQTLKKADLLILDEWGFIPFERTGTQLLFETISDCYEKRSIILTTNLPFDGWNTIFYDQKLTTAIIDRLVHHGQLIVHDGRSYRLLNSDMKAVG